jgi:hypothetical protein
MYLKFLTPPTPSVEKVLNVHEFNYVYKLRNINAFLINVDHNGMAVQLS